MTARHFTALQAEDIGSTLGIDWARNPFDIEQLRRGMDIELEHGRRGPDTDVTGDDPLLTGKIALAHLREFPDYYTRLDAMEAEAETAKAALSAPDPGETVVLYQSKYGSTRQYAEWIAEALHAEALPLDEVWTERLQDAGTVVIGGAVRMGKITCAEFLVRHWSILKDKNVVVFSVSGTNPDDPGIHGYFENSIPPSIRPHVRYVALWGRLGKLDLGDRLLMLFPRCKLRWEMLRHPGVESRGKYEGIAKPFDHVQMAGIRPVLEMLRGPGKKRA